MIWLWPIRLQNSATSRACLEKKCDSNLKEPDWPSFEGDTYRYAYANYNASTKRAIVRVSHHIDHARSMEAIIVYVLQQAVYCVL